MAGMNPAAAAINHRTMEETPDLILILILVVKTSLHIAESLIIPSLSIRMKKKKRINETLTSKSQNNSQTRRNQAISSIEITTSKKRSLFPKNKNKRNFSLSTRMLEMIRMHLKVLLMMENALSVPHVVESSLKRP